MWGVNNEFDGRPERIVWIFTGTFGVPGGNGNGKKVVDFYSERGFCVGYTYFKNENTHKYTRMASGQDKMEMNITYLIKIC